MDTCTVIIWKHWNEAMLIAPQCCRCNYCDCFAKIGIRVCVRNLGALGFKNRWEGGGNHQLYMIPLFSHPKPLSFQQQPFCVWSQTICWYAWMHVLSRERKKKTPLATTMGGERGVGGKKMPDSSPPFVYANPSLCKSSHRAWMQDIVTTLAKGAAIDSPLLNCFSCCGLLEGFS